MFLKKKKKANTIYGSCMFDHIIMDCYSVDHLLALINMHTSIRINFGLLFQDKVMLYLFIESGVLKSVLRIMSCMDY